MKEHYDYVIVGSGLYGALFAFLETQKGKKCLVIDKRSHIGGNIYTEKRDGINVHKYGAHIFHTSNKEVWDFVNKLTPFNTYINSPIAVYKNELYNLPFNMNTFHQMWGVKTPQEAKKKIESQKYKGEVTNLEEQALSLVGSDIYTKLIKGYTEKQWGRECKDLPSFIIKRIPLRFTYNNNYFNDTYQGVPINGYTALIERLLEGCDVKLNVDYLTDKEYYDSICDKVLYTGKIDEYFNYSLGKLEYRSLTFLTTKENCENFQGNAVVNYTDKDVKYTRTIEHKHFANDISEVTYVTYEYPCEWNESKEAYYPINDEKNCKLYTEYKKLASKEKKVIFGGRLAEYKYYNMNDIVEKLLNENKVS